MTNNPEITKSDLEQWANELCQLHWNIDYSGTIELKNVKWKCVNAQYIRYSTDKSIHVIQMSSKRNAERTIEEVRASLLHELVHWYLYKIGKRHGDTCSPFIAECLRVGASLSKTKAAKKALDLYITKQRC
jgi:hypothetical protein